MADTEDFTTLMAKVTALPDTWMPRREQPEWDRDFSGRAEIQTAFGHRTDKAVTWMREAVAFSDTLKLGFREDPKEDDSRLIAFAKDMREHIAKGKVQFED
jgi:hypothetical protein